MNRLFGEWKHKNKQTSCHLSLSLLEPLLQWCFYLNNLKFINQEKTTNLNKTKELLTPDLIMITITLIGLVTWLIWTTNPSKRVCKEGDSKNYRETNLEDDKKMFKNYKKSCERISQMPTLWPWENNATFLELLLQIVKKKHLWAEWKLSLACKRASCD